MIFGEFLIKIIVVVINGDSWTKWKQFKCHELG